MNLLSFKKGLKLSESKRQLPPISLDVLVTSYNTLVIHPTVNFVVGRLLVDHLCKSLDFISRRKELKLLSIIRNEYGFFVTHQIRTRSKISQGTCFLVSQNET